MSALPSNPNLAHLKKAKDLHKSFQASAAEVCALLQQHLPRFAQSSPDEILAAEFSLHDAQHVVAREYGFDHWSALRQTVENSAQSQQDDATTSRPGPKRSDTPRPGPPGTSTRPKTTISTRPSPRRV